MLAIGSASGNSEASGRIAGAAGDELTSDVGALGEEIRGKTGDTTGARILAIGVIKGASGAMALVTGANIGASGLSNGFRGFRNGRSGASTGATVETTCVDMGDGVTTFEEDTTGDMACAMI